MVVTFRNKNGKNGTLQKREELLYLHFLESSVQNYFEGFAYSKIMVETDTMELLKKEKINFLKTLGIRRFID